MVFFPVPGANFDLASFSFQVPISGLAKQYVPVAKQSARVSSDVFVFISPFQPGMEYAVNIFSDPASPDAINGPRYAIGACGLRRRGIPRLSKIVRVASERLRV